MPVSTRLNVSTVPFNRGEFSKVLEAETVSQDGARATPLAKYTLMAQTPASGEWVPWIDETLSDGEEFPMGIILADVTAAQMVAGDVLDIPILVGDSIFDEDQLVFDAVKTLATVIGTLNIRVDTWLRMLGLFPEATVDVDGYENA